MHLEAFPKKHKIRHLLWTSKSSKNGFWRKWPKCTLKYFTSKIFRIQHNVTQCFIGHCSSLWNQHITSARTTARQGSLKSGCCQLFMKQTSRSNLAQKWILHTIGRVRGCGSLWGVHRSEIVRVRIYVVQRCFYHNFEAFLNIFVKNNPKCT